ncbi:MAG: hypothetical protein HY466_02775 [Deltaproteobacteria bacterium]|nr:hypothetical protein [Deltaproteobacteria bacterium]
MQIGKTIRQLPFKLLVVTLISIFIAEIFVMAVMDYLPVWPPWAVYLFDSALLSFLVFPALYLFLFSPLTRHMGESRNATEVLLQKAVELERANQDLSAVQKSLEEKVRQFKETDAKLKESQKVTLSLLDDSNEAREQLTKAKEELQRFNDTLEDKVAEKMEALKAAQEKLVRTARLSAVGQLASSVAHEIRNPLTGLTNAAYFLEQCDPKEDCAEMKKYTGLIQRQVSLINQIASDLLNFAKARTPKKEPTDISKLIRETLEKFPPPQNVRLSVDIHKGAHQLKVDPLQISQILGNLITNAYQAMPKGGALNVRTENSGKEFKIVCADTGCGIPKERIPEIFEPLVTTKPKGTGLGLAIVRQLAEGHGGKVEVESQVGKGSKFMLKLPTEG